LVVAALVFFTAVVAPALQIAFMPAITVGAQRERSLPWVGMLLRYHPTSRLWSMIEVMMLGVLGLSWDGPALRFSTSSVQEIRAV
jgi:uncharacterized paraquat-inducible protein A